LIIAEYSHGTVWPTVSGRLTGRRARLDHRLDDAAEVVAVAPRRVLGGELDVVGEFPRPRDRGDRGGDDLVAGHLQLVLEVEIARRDERVDARPGRALERLARPVDVLVLRAAEGGDRRAAAHGLGHLANRLEVVVGGDRKAGLDHVDAELGQLFGEGDLLGDVHREPGRLLAVAQSGIENDDFSHGLPQIRFRIAWTGLSGEPARILLAVPLRKQQSREPQGRRLQLMGLTRSFQLRFLGGCGGGRVSRARAWPVAAGARIDADAPPDSNLTLPSTRLKSVKSRPVPTLLFSTHGRRAGGR
jgi:hypothetical protein